MLGCHKWEVVGFSSSCCFLGGDFVLKKAMLSNGAFILEKKRVMES